MAPAGRRYDATQRPPEVHGGAQGTGGLGVWCPELRELGAAAPHWSGCTAAEIMVFYFTSSSGEWAPRPPGSLLHGAGVSEAGTPRPSRSLDVVLKRLLRVGCLFPRPLGPLRSPSLRSRPCGLRVPPPQAGGRGGTPRLRSLHPRVSSRSSRADLPSLPGIGRCVGFFTPYFRTAPPTHPWPLFWLYPGNYAL